MQPIIELEKVSKYFGGITALNKASLKVNKGQIKCYKSFNAPK